jgi:acyl carrier protein
MLMIDSIVQFIFESLQEMDCDIAGLDENSQLGPRGADLSSLSLAELALRVEDQYGLRFGEEETERLSGLTIGQFCAVVAERTSRAEAAAE